MSSHSIPPATLYVRKTAAKQIPTLALTRTEHGVAWISYEPEKTKTVQSYDAVSIDSIPGADSKSNFQHVPRCVFKSDGTLDSNNREVLLVAGKSGSGKSTYLGQYAYKFLTMFPEGKCFIFMKDQTKPDYNVLIDQFPSRAEVIKDQELESLNPDDFANCLVLFDDIDTLPKKEKKRTKILQIQITLINAARSRKVYVGVSAHVIRKGDDESKSYLSEFTSVTVFPTNNTQFHQIKGLLTARMGIDEEYAKKLIENNKNTRWLTLFDYPTMVGLTPREVFLLK